MTFEQATGDVRAVRLSAARYLAVLACTALSVLGAVLVLVHGTRAMGRPPLAGDLLLQRQNAKLAALDAHTIFVGDSSAGNAISATEWSSLSGSTTQNLALMGAYGYAGSYNFVRRSLGARGVRNVIIFHTPDMMTRVLAQNAYQNTLDRSASSAVGSWYRAWLDNVNIVQVKKSFEWLASGRNAPTFELITDDYITQTPPMKVDPALPGLDPGEINNGQRQYLEQLGELCREHQLNCLYVHGPVASPICERSTTYLTEVARIIRSTGLTLVNEQPFCLPAEHVGDTEDHVAPPYKTLYTRKYYDVIAPLLR